MRRVLYIIIALVATLTASQVHAATKSCAPAQQTSSKSKPSIMDLPIFERLVLIVKHYETLHNGNSTWPYVGYGHRKLPGEKYYKGYRMSEAEADALLRKDLRKFCAIYEKYGDAKYLLGALAYNCGPGVVNKSSVLAKLKRGDRNIYKAYTAHCRYKGKFHKGLHKRRITEYIALFAP